MTTSSMIVVMVFIFGAGSWLILQQVRALARSAADTEEQLGRQVAELKRRVQTLERIVTDKRSQLNDQIDSL